VRGAHDRDDPERQAAELEKARPYLELAREIQAEVARIAADPAAEIDLLVEVIDAAPREERMKLARRIFADLSPERQWAVLEAVYGDEELASYLEAERAAHLAVARAAAERLDAVARARAEHRLDTRDVPAGELLTLGLFREREVRAAVARGHASSTCARRLVLRATGDGALRVIEDVFNPDGGYFVTAEYSAETWERDRLAGHAVVQVGSITGGPGQRESFEPVVYPGGRVDFEVSGRPVRGQLHLGFGMLSDVGIFAD
jgi:hypothetical protein